MSDTEPTQRLEPENLSSIPLFQHDTLNLNAPTIRLIRVLLDLSKEGLLQCDIKDGTISCTFTCLSYTWGATNSLCCVLIDGKLFWIQPNLWEFLKIARMKYASLLLWIDAICIDQTRIEERNHQVAQMGATYSAAERVITWLGKSKDIADFFRAWQVCYKIEASPSWWVDTREILLPVEAGWHLLAGHVYWTRAWITQEVAVAKRVDLLADDVELDAIFLKYITKIPWFSREKVDARFISHINFARKSHNLKGQSLLTLLYNLPNQHCGILRDRVYSLLWLAAKGSRVTVDYGSTDIKVLVNLVNIYSKSICLCSLGTLARAFGFWSLSLATTSSIYYIPSLEIRLRRADLLNRASDAAWNSAYATCCTLCDATMPISWTSGQRTFCFASICSTYSDTRGGHVKFHDNGTVQIIAGQLNRYFSGRDADALWFSMALDPRDGQSDQYLLRIALPFFFLRDLHLPRSRAVDCTTDYGWSMPKLCTQVKTRHAPFRVN